MSFKVNAIDLMYFSCKTFVIKQGSKDWKKSQREMVFFTCANRDIRTEINLICLQTNHLRSLPSHSSTKCLLITKRSCCIRMQSISLIFISTHFNKSLYRYTKKCSNPHPTPAHWQHKLFSIKKNNSAVIFNLLPV